MAYGGYYSPNFYPNYFGNQQMPPQAPQMPSNPVQSSTNGITWVLGESAAKSFPVGAGQTVVLMDREEPVMYMKSVDQSGMPLPLRIFDITERTAQHTESVVAKPETPDYVSRKEFDEFRESVKRSINGFRKPHNEREGEK
ncbi:MAG: hypothetical protein IKH75_11605 [Ruminococcus sp.]|nr:hypothetical protein [Ruminococcus sp.]